MAKAKASSPRENPRPVRQRLTREERQRQLMETAWQLVRAEGTDALTLGSLAERAGVTKPVVYDHFGTRAGLLAALYRDFDTRQTAQMGAALAASPPTLRDRARIIAEAYADCALAQGREMPGVMAALVGSPELDRVKRDCEADIMERCRVALAPFAKDGALTPARLRGMLGAADALSYAAAAGEITMAQAKDELVATIIATVSR